VISLSHRNSRVVFFIQQQLSNLDAAGSTLTSQQAATNTINAVSNLLLQGFLPGFLNVAHAVDMANMIDYIRSRNQAMDPSMNGKYFSTPQEISELRGRIFFYHICIGAYLEQATSTSSTLQTSRCTFLDRLSSLILRTSSGWKLRRSQFVRMLVVMQLNEIPVGHPWLLPR